MKSISLVVSFLLVAFVAFAGVPTQVSYQGQLYNNGSPATGEMTFSFFIFDQNTMGVALWSDTDTLMVNEGIFDAFLGANTPLPASIFTGNPLWLEIEVQGETLSPRQPLASVPYSFRSQVADTAMYALDGIGGEDSLWETNDIDVYRTSGNVGIGTSTPLYSLHTFGNIRVELGRVITDGTDSGTNKKLHLSGVGGLGFGVWENPLNPSNNATILNGDDGLFFTTDWGENNQFAVASNMAGIGLGLVDSSPIWPGITLALGDATTGLSRVGTYAIAVMANGTETVRFTTAGDVGIGTDSPTQKLDVRGNLRADEYFLRGSQVLNYIDSNSWRIMGLGGTNKIEINDTDVRLMDDLSPSSDGNYDLGVSTRRWRAVYSDNYYGDGSNLTGISGTTDNDWTISGNNVFHMTGNVGIHTNSPDAPLHIASTTVSAQGLLHVNATSPTGTSRGIFAEAWSGGSNSAAIFGQQNHANPEAAGGTFGVFGRILRSQGTTGHSSAAVFGDAIGNGDGSDPDNLPDPFDALANGVQGETWSTNNSAAGGRFYAAQGSGQADAVYGQTNSPDAGSYALYGSGPMLVTGTKSAGVFTESQGPSEMYSVESTEVWFEDIGEGQLDQGRARIEIESVFQEVVTIDEDHSYHVFLQFYDDVDMNQCVVVRDDEFFDVIEKNSGNSNAEFSYRITAKRKHHEDKRMRPIPVDVDRFMRPDLPLTSLGGTIQR